MTDLEVLDLHGNPDLVMPPKPVELQMGSGSEYYNIDFSLSTQLRLAGATAGNTPVAAPSKWIPLIKNLYRNFSESDYLKKNLLNIFSSKNRESKKKMFSNENHHFIQNLN